MWYAARDRDEVPRAAGMLAAVDVNANIRPFRTGRRIVWVGDALAPLRGQLPEAELDRVVHAIAAVIGIDVLVWMTDIAGLSREQAIEIMRWSARALLQAALPGGAGPGG